LSRRSPTLVVWAPWLTLPAAALIIAISYSYAATHRGDKLHYHLFWLGMVVFLGPASVRLLSRVTAASERYALVVAIGLFMYLPKFLRNPRAPLFADELTHWRQAEAVYRTGHLMQPNPVLRILQFFPGLSALTGSLRTLAPIPTYRVAVIVIALLHGAILLGVVVILERLIGSARVGAAGAFVYALNPGFMYTDAQFAYETLAMALLVWTIATATLALTERRDDRLRLGWILLGALLVGAITVTHHLSTYLTTLVLIVLAVIAATRSHREDEPREATRLILVLAAASLVFATGNSSRRSTRAPA